MTKTYKYQDKYTNIRTICLKLEITFSIYLPSNLKTNNGEYQFFEKFLSLKLFAFVCTVIIINRTTMGILNYNFGDSY